MIAAVCFPSHSILIVFPVDLFKQVVVPIGSLLIYLSGKLEGVVFLELDGEVAASEVFRGLMSRS